MKSFKDYICQIYKESSEKYELFKNLFNICLEKYTSETKDFFEMLASRDEEIKDILDKLKSNEKDIVSPNLADANFGNEEV